jgi:hypothetical protein
MIDDAEEQHKHKHDLILIGYGGQAINQTGRTPRMNDLSMDKD